LVDLVAALKKRELSCEDVFRAYSARILDMNPKVNALFDIRGVLPEFESGGELSGVPFSVKSSLDVKGFVTDEGSLNDEGRVAEHTVTCVENLQRAGGYCVGKSVMPEYGKSYSTETRLHGVTRNPLNLEYTPGGSSGGCAAAVAAGMVPFSVCTDAGGSARVPANFCGLYGLFPTPGSVAEGAAGRTALPFVAAMRSVGLIAKTLKDVEFLWRLIRQDRIGDAVAVGGTWQVDLGQRGLRVGVIREMNGVRPTAGILNALDEAAKRYEESGYKVEEMGAGVFGETLEPYIVLMGQASLVHEDMEAQQRGRARSLDLETEGVRSTREKVRRLLPELTVERLLGFLGRMQELRRRVYAEVFSRVDLVLMPVAACGVHRIGESLKVGERELQSYEAFQFCTSVNFLGLPSLAFPCGKEGLQVVGRRFAEHTLPPPDALH
jgi:Asp-tRNA(Asn)/Glu-tRNA(Gln) amidotransferase A subunit family amidase